MSAAAKRHLRRVAELSCVVGYLGWQAECGWPAGFEHRAEVHHLREDEGAAQRAQDTLVIPVCWNHHVGPFGIHQPKAFYRRTKLTELDLLAVTLERLA